MNYKAFIIEFVIAAPLVLGTSFLFAKILKEELRAGSTFKLASAICGIMFTCLILSRGVPLASFAYFQSQDPTVKQNEALQLKAQFMQELDQFMANPANISKDSKAKFFKKYSDLFPNGEDDRKIYYQNLLTLIQCNEAYFTDALTALKTKQNQKSDLRKQCQQTDGIFFNRKFMVPEEQARLNDQVIETIAKGKKIIQDNKEIEVNEGILKQNIEQQQKTKEMLKIIFTEGT